MGFSRETQEKINRFAREQSQFYLQEAEMSYLEQLCRKTDQTRRKVGGRLAKLKPRSEQGIEAQNDMALYMGDYMSDLMAQGLDEEAAFAKASESLRAASSSEQSADLQKKFQQYYQALDPALYESVGLFYGGFLFLGVAAGGLVGLFLGGGRALFLTGGWIDTLIGVGVGALVGMGLGQISHAVIVRRK